MSQTPQQIKRVSLVVIAFFFLAHCGPPKTTQIRSDEQTLAQLLEQGNANAIQQKLNNSNLDKASRTLIENYLLVLRGQHHQIVNQASNLFSQLPQFSAPQKHIGEQILLWAYAKKIYRKETAGQVRIFQREELLVAPSPVNFKQCSQGQGNCANGLRNSIKQIINPSDLTQILLDMAAKDPCINLTQTDRAGEFASNCLATRKGNLKLVLIEAPTFSGADWLAALK